jgi:hypothetical protein
MGEFKLPRKTLPTRWHDVRMVWLVSIAGVVLSLGILFFIAYGPYSVVHRVGPLLVYLIALIVLCALGTDFVALRRTFERVKCDLTFVLSQDELVRKSPGFPDVRISLPQIKSLFEQPGYLVVGGGDPPRKIVIPKNVENFKSLRAELTNYASLAPAPRQFSLGWITLLLSIISWSLLVWSRDINTTRAAGLGVLVLLGWESFRQRQPMLHSSKRVALWLLFGSAWLSAGFLIYVRVFRG